MTEKEITGKVHLSSSLTGFIKYFPVIIGVFGTTILIATGESESAIIPLAFLLLGLGTNFFIVDAAVDKDFIYIKQWTKEKKHSIDSIDKVGDFGKGMTIIDIKTGASTTKTFLIINDFDPSLFTDNSKDISSFILKIKAATSANKNQTH